MRRRIVGLVTSLLILGLMVPAVLASATVTVSPTDMEGWFFHQETGTSGSGSMVLGPDDPPLGEGSANLILDDAEDGWILGSFDHHGLKFSDLEDLSFYTYVESAPGPQSISLQFTYSSDVDSSDEWQGRLVFEPYYDAAINIGEWQQWDALELEGWWATGGAVQAECPQSAPCTLDEITSAFEDVGVIPDPAHIGVLLKAGSNWDGFDGNVDALTIGTADQTTTYDFEPGPASKDDCKKGGYEAFGFKNQGQCIKFVNTGKDSR